MKRPSPGWIGIAAAAVLFLWSSPAQARPMKPIATAQAFEEAWNTQDPERVSGFFGAEAVLTMAEGGERYVGKEGMRDFLSTHLRGYRSTSRDFKADGEVVSWVAEMASDHYRALGIEKVLLSKKAVVRDGAVASLELAVSAESRLRIRAAVEERNKERVRRLVEELFNRHNIGVVPQYVSPRYVDHHPPRGVAPDYGGVTANVAGLFNAFPEATVVLDDVLADGDKVMVRARLTGVQRGPWMGRPATGRRLEIESAHVVRLIDGQIVEHWGLADPTPLLKQSPPKKAP
ncbi:MAG TPA: ester cyclase [Elusimicrobiota bacterium]|nr:ester cyclase [Elusimicrobiota bacterium]